MHSHRPVVTWLRTASGGQVRGDRIVAIEVEQRNTNRWVLEAHTDDMSVWELVGEYPCRPKAAARATELTRRIDDG